MVSSCPLCTREDSAEDMIICDECESATHYTCAFLSSAEVERIDSFVCASCELSTGKLTHWKGQRARGKVLADKRKNYYEVERILADKTTSAGRSFKVLWKGYKQPSWVREEDMDGALDLLQAYLRSRGKPLSTIEAKIGSLAGPDETDESNFVTITEVIETVSKLRTSGGYQTNLEIGRWPIFGNEDKLFIFDIDRHCYVLLYIATDRGYIADGLNSYLEDPSIRARVDQEMKASSVNIRPIRFDQQIKSDHCGGSAALIALELMRAYRKHELDSIKMLHAPISWRKLVRSILHPHKSESVIDSTLTQRRQKWACERCEKRFRTRKSLVAHKLSHISKTG